MTLDKNIQINVVKLEDEHPAAFDYKINLTEALSSIIFSNFKFICPL